MKPSKGRQILSWIVGILVFGFLYYWSEKLASSLGLSTSYYNIDGDNRYTSLGLFFLTIKIIVASRIGMLIYHGNFKDGIGQHTNLLLLVIVTCIGVSVLIQYVIWESFERELKRNLSPFFYDILDISLQIGIGWIGYTFYQKKKLSQKRKTYVFKAMLSENEDCFLRKFDGLFYLGCDSENGFKMWKFNLPLSFDEQYLAYMFHEKTRESKGKFDFYNWLEEQGIKLQEHNK